MDHKGIDGIASLKPKPPRKSIDDLTPEDWDNMAKSVPYIESLEPGAGEEEAVKHDKGKLRLDLVPAEMEEALAQGLTAGLKKGYKENDWAKGLKFSRNIAASKRHLNAWRKGTDIDEETGVNHLKLAFLNLGMIVYQIEKGRKDLDDRI